MLMDGKELAKDIKIKLKNEIDDIKRIYGVTPAVASILVGEDPASQVYLNSQIKSYQDLGIAVHKYSFSKEISEAYLLNLIDKLNKDDNVDGILVQLPLPQHINEEKVLDAIVPSKDVDGFHPNNIANLFLGEESLVPCTPKGMMVLLEEINYDLAGKEVVIVGRSNIVAKPVALLCLQKKATVTIAHSQTKDLKAVCSRADVLIAAIGKPKFFNHEYVKDGAVVLDVGINRDENNKLCGDVDFDDVKDKVSAITPVPGGIGPMTITMLMKNTIEAFYHRNGD